jgi:hypothetical protein
MLQRLKPDRRVTEVDLPVKVLDYCKGKAARLKNNPLYAPYYAEYLWNSEEGSHEDLSPSRQGEIQGATSVRHS